MPNLTHTQYHWLTQYISSWWLGKHHEHSNVCFLKVLQVNHKVLLSNQDHQCESDFRPFNIRRRITSMPPLELSLLIQPWVLLRLIFLGWYSVPLFRVRTCWYCHGSCWNTPEPSACEEIGPHLEIWGPAAALGTIQLLNNLRWVLPVNARFPAGMLSGKKTKQNN